MKEALKLALEALKKVYDNVSFYGEVREAIAAIEAVLAQPEQNLNCKSVQARLATAWGYVKAEQEHWLLETTQTLAKHMAREFYPEVTQWECLDNLAGVISQIDNMTTGLMLKPEQESTGCACRWNFEGDRVVTCARHEGWLEAIVECDERLVLSGADEARPAVDAIRDFAKMRGLSLDDAKVQDWNTTPPQRTWVGLTYKEKHEIRYTNHMTSAEFIDFIEAKLKEKNT